MYNSRLPAPSMYGVTAGSPVYRTSKMSKSDNRMPREEQVQEIIELKRALAKTRQDLQKTRSRRQSQDTRSSSDEETYRRDDLGGSFNGSMSGSLSGMSAVSNKPCLNRELVAKLRSMTETIKMLSTENVALREENDELLSGRDDKMALRAENDPSEVSQLRAVIHSYEKQVNQLGDKVKSLENEMENKEKVVAQAPEKDKYKSLARRLKEERNQYKEMVEEKKKEQDELKEEIEKMTELIGDLRENCGKLQEELLQVRLDSPRRMSEKSVQTQPLSRRASIGGGETQGAQRSKITPKRTRSSVSSNSSQSSSQTSSQSSPRQNQISRSIELSRPKIRNNNNNSSSSSVPNSPARGPRIVKPVQRSQTSNNIPKCSPSPTPKPNPNNNQQKHRNGTASGTSTPSGVSQSPSKIPSLSRIPTPSKSRIPVKPSATLTAGVNKAKAASEYQENDEVLYISEEMVTTSDDNMDVVESRSPAPKIQDRRCSQESASMEVESVQDEIEDDFPPPPIPEEAPTMEPDFPAPPAPADLEKLSLEAELNTEDPMITTPRTLRRADSMRQRMAARRIQRTWKHFYQELEEKKSDGSNVHQQPISSLHQPEKHQENETNINSRVMNQEENVEDAIAGVQAAVLSHGARVATLAAARARGGIYTARPWVAKDNSETESENEDLIENLQGLIRSHSFRLKTLREEEDVFRVGKVSSIRAKFSRRSPDGASDDYLNEADRNV